MPLPPPSTALDRPTPCGLPPLRPQLARLRPNPTATTSTGPAEAHTPLAAATTRAVPTTDTIRSRSCTRPRSAALSVLLIGLRRPPRQLPAIDLQSVARRPEVARIPDVASSPPPALLNLWVRPVNRLDLTSPRLVSAPLNSILDPDPDPDPDLDLAPDLDPDVDIDLDAGLALALPLTPSHIPRARCTTSPCRVS